MYKSTSCIARKYPNVQNVQNHFMYSKKMLTIAIRTTKNNSNNCITKKELHVQQENTQNCNKNNKNNSTNSITKKKINGNNQKYTSTAN